MCSAKYDLVLQKLDYKGSTDAPHERTKQSEKNFHRHKISIKIIF